jgi:ATP-dependent exoDNAse (exonuclease V) beta subunit
VQLAHPSVQAKRMAAILDGLTSTSAEAAMLQGSGAGAGRCRHGKTRTLTASVAPRIAMSCVPPSRILAVTFTNKS